MGTTLKQKGVHNIAMLEHTTKMKMLRFDWCNDTFQVHEHCPSLCLSGTTIHKTTARTDQHNNLLSVASVQQKLHPTLQTPPRAAASVLPLNTRWRLNSPLCLGTAKIFKAWCTRHKQTNPQRPYTHTEVYQVSQVYMLLLILFLFWFSPIYVEKSKVYIYTFVYILTLVHGSLMFNFTLSSLF